jgi:hypothetical protein
MLMLRGPGCWIFTDWFVSKTLGAEAIRCGDEEVFKGGRGALYVGAFVTEDLT